MENQVLNVQDATEMEAQQGGQEVRALDELQLAFAGGGSAEVCPY